MAVHKGPTSLRPRCTRSGSSVAAIPVYHARSKYAWHMLTLGFSSNISDVFVEVGFQTCAHLLFK
jgi:hypothetical protein